MAAPIQKPIRDRSDAFDQVSYDSPVRPNKTGVHKVHRQDEQRKSPVDSDYKMGKYSYFDRPRAQTLQYEQIRGCLWKKALHR